LIKIKNIPSFKLTFFKKIFKFGTKRGGKTLKLKILSVLLLTVLVMSACGKTPEQSDKKEDVQKIVEANQSIMTASAEAQKNVLNEVQSFEGKKYDGLKNLIKSNQELQKSYLNQINENGTTEYRAKISMFFAKILSQRISDYDELLKLVRIQDKSSLQSLGDSIKSKDAQFEESTLIQLNELLKSKKVKTIDSIKK